MINTLLNIQDLWNDDIDLKTTIKSVLNTMSLYSPSSMLMSTEGIDAIIEVVHDDNVPYIDRANIALMLFKSEFNDDIETFMTLDIKIPLLYAELVVNIFTLGIPLDMLEELQRRIFIGSNTEVIEALNHMHSRDVLLTDAIYKMYKDNVCLQRYHNLYKEARWSLLAKMNIHHGTALLIMILLTYMLFVLSIIFSAYIYDNRLIMISTLIMCYYLLADKIALCYYLVFKQNDNIIDA